MVKLDDYDGDNYEYTLDPATGVYSSRRVAPQQEPVGRCGFASEERLKDPNRGRVRVLVAIYSDGERLLFSIHSHVFVLSAPGARVEKVRPWLLNRRVSVLDQGRVVFEATFLRSWLKWSSWPEQGDIFDYARRCLRSRESIFRSIFVWHASCRGQSIRGSAFQAEMERYVGERLAAEGDGQTVPSSADWRHKRKRHE
jgi:hypothetical protein